MTPLLASLEIYDEVGMQRLRQKSELQTAFLFELLDLMPSPSFHVITPRDAKERGSQLSLYIHQSAEKFLCELEKREIVCDFRPPNILRVTPSPLYNTFDEIYQFAFRLDEFLRGDP